MPWIVLNGERRELGRGATVEDAVDASGAREGARGVAVAVDGEVVPRGQWGRDELREGQRIEVLQAVQGG
jgi:sulfur carrier protein